MPKIPPAHTNKHIISNPAQESTDKVISPPNTPKKFMPSSEHEQKTFLKHRTVFRAKDDLETLNEKDSGTVIGSAFTGLDLLSGSCSEEMKESVASFLKEKEVGVTFTGVVPRQDVKGAYFTAGDNAAEVQVLRSLVDMKLPKVSLFICHGCSEKLSIEQYEIVCSKLKMLFPFAHFSGSPPWHVVMDGTEIEILAPEGDKRDIDFVFTFADKGQRLSDITERSACNAQSLVVVKPYQFAHHSVYNESVTERGKVESKPWLSHDAIISQKNVIDEKESVYTQLETYLDRSEVSKAERVILAKNLVGLVDRIKNGHVNFSFTYGLHHVYLKNRGGIVKYWAEALGKLSAEDERVGVLGVKFDKTHFTPDMLGDLSEGMLDITGSDFLDTLDSQALKECSLCMIPNLPAPVFNWLASSANCTSLVEGANLTSFFLENGCSFLNLFPDFTTGVSYDLGDILEAMKQHALSFKLSKKAEFSEADSEKWRQLHRLVCDGKYSDLDEMVGKVRQSLFHSHHFQLILGEIPHLKGSQLSSSAEPASVAFSISSLVKRLSEKYGNRDKPIEGAVQDALMMIFEPPGPGLFVRYMKEARDPESFSSSHRKVVSEGLKNPIHHGLITSVYQLGVSNGWIKSVLPGKQNHWQKELIEKSDWQDKCKKLGLQVGDVLKKECNGEIHEVSVTSKSFVYQGKSYKGLMPIVRAIGGSTKGLYSLVDFFER